MKRALFVMALLAGLVGQARASIVVSSMSAAGVQLAAAPASNTVTVIKGCSFANGTTVDNCAQLLDGATLKLTLCAKAGTIQTTPFLANANPAVNADGLSLFFGERLSLSGAFNVTSGTAAPSGSGGATLTCAIQASRLN